MDVVIVAQYLLDITKTENLNSRFVYLANMLNEKHSVEIVTSDFIHTRKENVQPIESYHGIKITMLHESGYKKNVSLQRFASHAELARNIADYLRRRRKPDVVYCAVPSTDVALAVARYCRKSNVKFIADIQDLWPEAFKMVFNIPVISDLIFYPFTRKADEIYKTANALVSVSETYLNRARCVNRSAAAEVVFLGTDRQNFDSQYRVASHDHETIRIVYVGSLEKSYDLTTAIRAVSQCENVQLVVIGDGSCRVELERFVESCNANCMFTGYLPYREMISRLAECDIAINPIHKGSAGSIINKVGDYAMAGLPVINTQESQEYRQLLEKYGCGINCGCENVEDVVQAIRTLVGDVALRKEMGRQSRYLGESFFDRTVTYPRIVYLIESI